MVVAILIFIAIAPLILLAAFILADRLGLRVADTILDWTMLALIGQRRIGSLINIGLGFALIAGCIYFASDLDRASRWIAAIFVTLFGLWRIWRGVAAWPR